MGKKLFIGNLGYDTTEDGLRDHFAANGGSVSSVAIITDRDTGRPRGFGFVEMGSEEEAASAVEKLDGMPLDGRSLRVSVAHDRPERSGGGGRGRGGYR